MAISELQRDKVVTRAVHRLFWQAMLKNRWMLAITLLCFLPSFYVFSILIPLQVAYGMQMIITHHFNEVGGQALTIVLLDVVASIIFGIT
jgi:hypothetical protein